MALLYLLTLYPDCYLSIPLVSFGEVVTLHLLTMKKVAVKPYSLSMSSRSPVNSHGPSSYVKATTFDFTQS
jgi:hypothetical protein